MKSTQGSPRFWTIYIASWTFYAALYWLALMSTDVRSFFSVVIAIANVVPEAVLGLAVLALCRTLPWSGSQRLWFGVVHVIAASAFSGLSTLASFSLFALLRVLEGGPPIRAEDWELLPWQFLMGMMLYSTVASVGYVFETVARLRAEEARVARAETLRTQAELRALRAQMQPHFLFNTLHSLLALVRNDQDAAEVAIEQFGDLVRYAVGADQQQRDLVRLAEEWEFVGNYLALEKLRIGDRLEFQLETEPEALSCRVPAYCLQPLVENSIRHGIAPQAASSQLLVRARRVGPRLELLVRDDGLGCNPATLESPAGLGLKLVRQRLETVYGDSGRLWIDCSPNQGFTARIDVPVNPPGSSLPG